MNFTDLHTHSVYSLRDGYSTIPEKIERAKELGYSALAMTEHGTTTGLMDLYLQCQKAGLKPILGYEGYFSYEPDIKGGDTYHVLLIAKDIEGYHNLLKISDYATSHYYYKPRLGLRTLRENARGLILSTACVGGILGSENHKELVKELHDIFGDDFYLEVQPHDCQSQIDYNKKVFNLAKETGYQVLVTGDSHYARPEDDKWHRAFLDMKPDAYHLDKEFWLRWHIEHRTTYGSNLLTYDKLPQDKIDELWDKERHYVYYESHDFYMMSRDEMMQKLHYLDQDLVQQGLDNVSKVIDKCNVDIPTGGENFPVFNTNGVDIVDHIKALCRVGWIRHGINKKTNKQAYLDRFLMEMDMLTKLHYLNYFAILADMIQHCKDTGIPVGVGRGSVGGSLVAYLCGITEVDPVEYDLVFERFANPERVTLPDIDTDLSTEKRQLAIDYVQKKYGEVFNVRTVSDLQDKGAVVKAAKFLGMTHSEATRLSKNINSVDDLPEGEVKEYAKHFVGRLNAYGKHASAVAVFPRDHTEWCSVEKQGDDRVAAQDFHIMEKQGLLKLDLLGLTTLDIIQQCINHIKGNFDINKIDYADPLTAKLLQAGNTDGVFQVESQTMTSLIQGIKAKDVRDLSAVVALGRPAILDMGLEQTFIKRRNGEEIIEYKDQKLQPILEETEGLMLYQEQVMKVVQVMCGYSLGEADNVRRVIGRKVKEDVAEIKADIVKRGVALGTPQDIMEAIGDEVEAFAGYGFNHSHSVAYAMTAWRTAYLKAHYPCEFMAAVLDANREDKEKFSYYISSCEKMGVEIRKPSVSDSQSICTPLPKENAIQLGFSCIAGVKNKKVDTTITDAKQYLEEHSNYNKTVLTGLVKSGALDDFSDCSRSELLEYVDWVKDKRKSRPDFTFSGNEVESDGLMEFSVLGYAFTDVFSQFNLDWLPFGAVAAIITSVKAHKTRKGKPMAFVKADIRGKGVQELVIFDDIFKNLEKGKCYALKLRDTIINDFTELKKK